jgi:hypothetical protein
MFLSLVEVSFQLRSWERRGFYTEHVLTLKQNRGGSHNSECGLTVSGPSPATHSGSNVLANLSSRVLTRVPLKKEREFKYQEFYGSGDVNDRSRTPSGHLSCSSPPQSVAPATDDSYEEDL